MNWLSMMPEKDRKEIVAELCLMVAGHINTNNGAQTIPHQPTLATVFGSLIDAAFVRHGFRQPHSVSSVTHNIMAENTARDRDAAQREALDMLVTRAKDMSAWCQAVPKSAHARNVLDLAIAAVEREFKL